MLLSPTLRKIMTVALLLPAAVLANSSYADCAPERSYSVELDGDRWQLEYEVAHKQRAERVIALSPEAGKQNGRLSRRDFYGQKAPVAIIEL